MLTEHPNIFEPLSPPLYCLCDSEAECWLIITLAVLPLTLIIETLSQEWENKRIDRVGCKFLTLGPLHHENELPANTCRL